MTIIKLAGNYRINDNVEDHLMGISVDEIYSKIKNYLLDNGVSSGYSVGCPDSNDVLCFHIDDPFWVVYYSERGQRTGSAFFESWMSAADFYVREVLGREKVPRLINWS